MNVISIHEWAKQRATDADCLWFEQHPDRVYRMRNMAAGELPDRLKDWRLPGTNWRKVVAQVPSMGIRFWVQVLVTDDVSNDKFDDVRLQDIFRECAPALTVKQHEIFLAELKRGPPHNS